MQKLAWLGALAISVGVTILIAAYFWSDPQSSAHYHPFAAYLATNLGGLFVFTASYTLLSELQLKRDFAREMSASIDGKLQTLELNKSILSSGITEIMERFSDERLSKRLAGASSAKMLVMRNDTFFRANHEELRARISGGQLRLEVVLPNPRNSNLMTLLCTKYSDLPDSQKLAASIAASANTWLREQIWQKCAPEQRSGIALRLTDNYPVFSAYLFDDKELWYIPYHHRKNWHPIPVFIYRGNLATLEIYKDVSELFATAKFDLNQAV
jgi:hypothetical protein